jgi:hypothetical protein
MFSVCAPYCHTLCRDAHRPTIFESADPDRDRRPVQLTCLTQNYTVPAERCCLPMGSNRRAEGSLERPQVLGLLSPLNASRLASRTSRPIE